MSHIIGTAGHIDHGKTALVRALTGQDTDRLKEEKQRGISIDLGFAFLDLPNGQRVGIVDVPGHERFIRNMLAGAHGIDLVLLVVAADDGVMPQTEEHLDILHLLGAAHGVVALTKTDLVDTARLAAVREEIEILLHGTSLQGAPIVPVSSVSGAGIPELRGLIEGTLAQYQRVDRSGYFRLPIDRAFVMHGHGTVVTGTAIGGKVHPGDTLLIVPGGCTARVRSVQVHGVEGAEASSGQRVALNLTGVERAAIGRGQWVCDPRLDRVTDRLDVWVELRPSGARAAVRAVKSHAAVRVYLGTAEALGKVIWLDGQRELGPGHSAHGQLVLRAPIHAMRGDRFVLRNESAQRTIGGGEVVHPFARPHRRRDRDVLLHLDAIRSAPHRTPSPALLAGEGGGEGSMLRAFLQLEPDFAVSCDFLAQASGIDGNELGDFLAQDPSVRPLPDAVGAEAFTTVEKWEVLRTAVRQTLGAFHKQTPLVPGMEMELLRRQVAPELAPKIFRSVVEALAGEKVLLREDSLLRLAAHKVALRRDEQELANRAEALLVAGGVTPPDIKQLEAEMRLPRPRLLVLLQQLEREARVAKVDEGLYFARQPLEHSRALLSTYCRQHGEINAATFRDLLGASRKFSIALLDYFDRTGFTLRVGDIRKLRR